MSGSKTSLHMIIGLDGPGRERPVDVRRVQVELDGRVYGLCGAPSRKPASGGWKCSLEDVCIHDVAGEDAGRIPLAMSAPSGPATLLSYGFQWPRKHKLAMDVTDAATGGVLPSVRILSARIVEETGSGIHVLENELATPMRVPAADPSARGKAPGEERLLALVKAGMAAFAALEHGDKPPMAEFLAGYLAENGATAPDTAVQAGKGDS